jgi:hypothetical protein
MLTQKVARGKRNRDSWGEFSARELAGMIAWQGGPILNVRNQALWQQFSRPRRWLPPASSSKIAAAALISQAA